MKIPSAYLSGAYTNMAVGSAKVGKKSDADVKTGKGSAPKQDELVLSRNSDMTKMVGRIATDISEVSAKNNEKIEKLRSDVESGEYKIDAGDIADAMLKSGFIGEA